MSSRPIARGSGTNITGESRRASIRPSCPSSAYRLHLNFVNFTRSPARVCSNDSYTDRGGEVDVIPCEREQFTGNLFRPQPSAIHISQRRALRRTRRVALGLTGFFFSTFGRFLIITGFDRIGSNPTPSLFRMWCAVRPPDMTHGLWSERPGLGRVLYLVIRDGC